MDEEKSDKNLENDSTNEKVEENTEKNPEKKEVEQTEEKKQEEVKEDNSEKEEIKKEPVEEKPEVIPKSKSAKEGSFMPIFLVMLLAFVIAGLWDKIPVIKNSINFVLNPTAGALLSWNLNIGMLIIVFVITVITTLVQKYATDQDTLKELRKEQKEIQKQMKEFRSHPEKMMELQKKQMAMFPKQMKLSMRGIVYTIIPFALFFQWFRGFFTGIGDPRFILGLSWFWFYLISAIVISSLLRKWWKVV